MAEINFSDADLGPLAVLVGTWKGEKGRDMAPEKEGLSETLFYETIIFESLGTVTNAEEQILGIVHYRQEVAKKANDEVFHHETGYWLWDHKTGEIIQSLAIPRAVSLLAGGSFKISENLLTLEVKAEPGGKFPIIESVFMKEKAHTSSFEHTLSVSGNTLKYRENTVVEIYGKVFDHTDENELTRVEN